MAVAVAAAMMLPGVSHALGLGRAVGEPVLGESLLIEVPVTGTIDRPLDSDCVSVRRSPDSIDAEYFPRDLTARVDRQGGVPRILLTTRSAIRQPLVEFRVSVSCGYNLSHDYLLMVSPRREAPQAPAATTARPDAAATTGAGAAPAGAPSAPVETVAGGSLPDGLAGRKVVIDKDMTLEQLARKHFPGPLRQGRFMRWVAEANPHLFDGAKQLRQHRLSAGQELVIPNGVPPRRPGDYQNGLSPLGEPMTADEVAAASGALARRKAEQPREEPVPSPSRTPAPADGRNDRLVVGSGSGTKRDEKEAIALVDRLTGMMEQQVATQSANDEKVRQLEAATEELRKTIAKLEKDAADREARWLAERQAEKSAREQEEKHDWGQLVLAVAGGGILGAGLLLGLRTLAGRRRPVDETEAGFPAPPPAGQPPARSMQDEGARPGTAFDIGLAAAGEEAGHPRPPSGAAGTETPPAAVPLEVTLRQEPIPAAFFESGLDEHRTKAPASLPTIDFEPPRPAPATPSTAEALPSDPATAAIELANIMTSMGLGQSAAQTLVEHIRDNPRQSLHQWLKLLEIHRMNGNRAEFEKHAGEVRLHFNVQPDDWDVSPARTRASLEDYPHIRAQLVKLWRKPEMLPVLQALLMDNREGTRAGFPQTVAEEILLLLAISSSDAA